MFYLSICRLQWSGRKFVCFILIAVLFFLFPKYTIYIAKGSHIFKMTRWIQHSAFQRYYSAGSTNSTISKEITDNHKNINHKKSVQAFSLLEIVTTVFSHMSDSTDVYILQYRAIFSQYIIPALLHNVLCYRLAWRFKKSISWIRRVNIYIHNLVSLRAFAGSTAEILDIKR